MDVPLECWTFRKFAPHDFFETRFDFTNGVIGLRKQMHRAIVLPPIFWKTFELWQAAQRHIDFHRRPSAFEIVETRIERVRQNTRANHLAQTKRIRIVHDDPGMNLATIRQYNASGETSISAA